MIFISKNVFSIWLLKYNLSMLDEIIESHFDILCIILNWCPDPLFFIILTIAEDLEFTKHCCTSLSLFSATQRCMMDIQHKNKEIHRQFVFTFIQQHIMSLRQLLCNGTVGEVSHQRPAPVCWREVHAHVSLLSMEEFEKFYVCA